MKNLSFKKFLVITCMLIALIVEGVTSAIALYYLNSTSEYAYNSYDKAMSDGYNTEIKSQVQSSIAVLQHFYDRYKAGEMTEAQAKYEAKEAVRKMRYRDDQSGYMWIDDTNYILVMHPILPQNEGNNRYNLEDQNGVMIVQEIMKAANAGGGYNQFYFTKSDGVTVALKIAYSEKFDPWGWVVTTGNYVDDMDAQKVETKQEIKDKFNRMLITIVIVGVVLIIITSIISVLESNVIVKPLIKTQQMAHRMAEGDLTINTNIKNKNEIGQTAAALDIAQENIKGLVGEITNISISVDTALKDFDSAFKQMSSSIEQVSTAVDDIAQNVLTQAEYTKTASDDVEVIGESIITTEKEVAKLDNNARTMSELSSKSMDTLMKLVDISNVTKNQIDIMQDQVHRTNMSVDKIKSVTSVINGISDETDMLALNASIEAARVGEAGRGFAVVAEQIGNLAKESAENVNEIEKVINEVSSNSSESLRIMQDMVTHVASQFEYISETQNVFTKLNDSLHSCVESSESIKHLTDTIEVQRKGIMKVLEKLNEIAQDNAAASQETTAMSAELSEMVSVSNDTINSLEGSVESLTEDIKHFKI